MRLLRISILLSAVFLLNACATISCMYFGINCPVDVEVNSFSNSNLSGLHNSKFFIFENYQVQNPFLEQEVGAKIKVLLNTKGFARVDKAEESHYIILFRYGIDQGQTYSETYSYESTKLNIYSGQLEPTTEVGSSSRTVYNRHLILYLYKTEGLSEKSLPVWMAEVTSKGGSSDLREIINYLLVGAFEHFGEDTKGLKNYSYQPPKK